MTESQGVEMSIPEFYAQRSSVHVAIVVPSPLVQFCCHQNSYASVSLLQTGEKTCASRQGSSQLDIKALFHPQLSGRHAGHRREHLDMPQ